MSHLSDVQEINGRHAFRAEVWALQELKDTEAVAQGSIPSLLGVDQERRRVMMSLLALSTCRKVAQVAQVAHVKTRGHEDMSEDLFEDSREDF